MKLRTFALIAVLTLGIAGLLFSGGLTSGKGKMSGTVTDAETGAPLEGVTVKLYLTSVKQFHKPFPKTGKDGRWKSLYLRKGNWNVDYEKSGYETKMISYLVDPTPGSKNPPMEVTLKKMEGPTVGVNVLKEIENGKKLMADGEHDKAVAKFLKILSENKDDPGIDIVNLYIGNSFGMKGDDQKAIEYYKKSLVKYPKHKGLLVSIGNAYNNLKDYDNAMQWFSKLSINEIGNADTLYNIGVIAYNKGNFDEAIKYFIKATELNPKFAEAFFQLGMTYAGLNKAKETVATLQTFIQLAPDSANAAVAKDIIAAYKDMQ
ncbi:MAG: tetratricopeptide repeat protein [bacterium]|nr:tetratricopeptide repeat protein [bacterium]